MKLYLIVFAIVLIGFGSVCHCNVVNKRQSQDQPKFIVLAQIEDFLKLLTFQVSRLTTQFTRMLAPQNRDVTRPEFENDVKVATTELRDIQKNFEHIHRTVSKVVGGLQSESGVNTNNVQNLPIMRELLEWSALAQRQLSNFINGVTRILTNGYRAENKVNNKDGFPVQQIGFPFLTEILEYLRLVQVQLNRFTRDTQRILNGEQQ